LPAFRAKVAFLPVDGAAGKVGALAAQLGGLGAAAAFTWARSSISLLLVTCGFGGVCGCSVGAGLLSQDSGQGDARTGLTGQERDGLIKSVAGFIEARVLLEGAAQDGPCIPIVGTQGHRLFQLYRRVVELADLHIKNPERVRRVLQGRVHLARSSKFGDGVADSVFEFVSHPQVVMQLRIAGVEREGGLKVGDGFIERRELYMGNALVLIEGRVGRRNRHGLLEVGQAIFGFCR